LAQEWLSFVSFQAKFDSLSFLSQQTLSAIPLIFSGREILAIAIRNRSLSAILCQENAVEECHCLKGVLMIPMCEKSFFDGQSMEEGVTDQTGKLPRQHSGRRKRRSRRLS
jgi:hypothetical protein